MPDGGLLTARAALAHRGRSMAVSTAELTNEDDKTIALATSSAMRLARPWSDAAAVADRDAPAPEWVSALGLNRAITSKMARLEITA